MFSNFTKLPQILTTTALASMLLSGSVAQSQELIPRSLLVDMAREQFSILCESEVFTSCMGFTSKSCLGLSEKAIKQCLLPLPDEISPEKLENNAIESCPSAVYADAGFPESEAEVCFNKAMGVGTTTK